MIVFRDVTEVPAGFGPSVVAIGKFDGVHAGHRAVIDALRVRAAEAGCRCVIVTFDRNPLAVVRPDRCPPTLVSLERKLELLADTGVDATLVLTFDQERSEQAPEEFVQEVLHEALGAIHVLVGDDFRFGHRGAGDVALLRELGAQDGFAVGVVSEVHAAASRRRVSSTLVRELLAEGDVAGAGVALGREVSVRGEVVHGLKRGRELGFPTANLSSEVNALVPADGVYAGWMLDHTSAERFPAAISVGTNPQFDDVVERQVEAHVVDRTGLDLYGHQVTVEFVQRLRGMSAFKDLDTLIAQIKSDVDEARRVLGLTLPASAGHDVD